MKLSLGSTALRINISFAAAVTLTLIIDESGLCAAVLFCCVVHEMGHIIPLILLGEKPKVIELSFYGVRLERRNSLLSISEEMLVHASGPAANFVLSAILFVIGNYGGIRTVAVASLCMGLFNLLPCKPLDGGNLLGFILLKFAGEETGSKICRSVSLAVSAVLLVSGAILAVKNGNITLVCVAIYLFAMTFIDKKHSNFSNNML